ncbi:mitochondrial tRNA-specific 2-thiouridylase 1-like isoform X1 [Saccostrea cucullata]|uniref:mitochondrial tRNA-specific 2-thiouridylase 1-like isoform X1 n=2 Tax=Saccostrea cuccullata TaxID=36930 RepID=UPI002ED20EC8
MTVVNSLKRVVCGVSGGVDSAVSAYVLKQKGYEVIGLFMKNWDEKDESGQCSSDRDKDDAKFVCQHIGIPFHEVNFVKEYWNDVFSPFLKEYQTGSVPNPDIVCNRLIKFGVFLRYAQTQFSADAVATGHYARTSVGENLLSGESNHGVKLLKAVDSWKDQTYFLSQIPQKALQRALFPLGGLLKSEVKQIASEIGLQKIARKKESMGICFVGKRKFPSFIGEYIEPKPGNIINVETGEVVGTHHGIHHYTLGQKLIHVNHGRFGKCFIVDKDRITQDVIIAPGTNHPALFNQEFYTTLPYWIHQEPDGFSEGRSCVLECRFQRTYVPVTCIVTRCDKDQVRVTLNEPMRAITPGQYAVFYHGEECLGSGVINTRGPSVYELQQNKERKQNIKVS